MAPGAAPGAARRSAANAEHHSRWRWREKIAIFSLLV